MLFIFDISVAILFNSGTASQADIDALDYIALGSAEGSHRIGGSRSVLMDLCSYTGLNPKTKKSIERALSRIGQEGALRTKLSIYTQVVASGTTPTQTIIGSQKIITAPLRWFNSSHKIQPTALIGENLSDAFLLIRMGEVGAFFGNLPYLPISANPINGGGSTTPNVLLLQIQSSRFCLCVVDSDKPSPNGNFGGTATSVQPYKCPVSYPIIEVIETNGRDLENLLPDKFYKTCYSGPRHLAMTTLLEQLTNYGEHELRSHVDIEKGITIKQVVSHTPATPDRIFWDSKISSLIGIQGINPTNIPCYATGICSATTLTTNCSCVVVAGNPSNILDKFLETFRDEDRYTICNFFTSDHLKQEWTRIGTAVASWCCGDDRLRI